jgi:predicted DNA-binding transcriptional regulator AlpA
MLPELDAVMSAARTLAPDELPRLLGDLETVRAVAWSRLTAPAPPTQRGRDELLDIEEAARRLGISASYLYRNHRRFTFSRRVGRSLRFSAEGIESYIQQSGVLTPRRKGAILTPVTSESGEDKRK